MSTCIAREPTDKDILIGDDAEDMVVAVAYKKEAHVMPGPPALPSAWIVPTTFLVTRAARSAHQINQPGMGDWPAGNFLSPREAAKSMLLKI